MHNSTSDSRLWKFNLTSILLNKAALLTLILWSFSFYANAQNTSTGHLDTLVNRFVGELKAEKVDTICLYEIYWIGFIPNSRDSCNTETIRTTYIIWLKNNQTYLTKKDNCFDYSTITIIPDSMWNSLFTNIDRIKKEKVKPFEFIDKDTKKVFGIGMDHTVYQKCSVLIGNKIVELSFDTFDFQKKNELGREGEVNINYKHNKNLKGKIFVDELDRLTTEVEENKRLTRTRR